MHHHDDYYYMKFVFEYLILVSYFQHRRDLNHSTELLAEIRALQVDIEKIDACKKVKLIGQNSSNSIPFATSSSNCLEKVYLECTNVMSWLRLLEF